MSENLTLYHGGPGEFLGKVISGKVPLIGKRVFDDTSFSGTLTNDEQFARRWAVRKRGYDPVLLKYSIPQSLLIDEGLLAFKEAAHGFVTNLEIEYDKIPDIYRQALFSFNFLDDSMVRMLVKLRKLSFHQVPFEYLQGHENL